MGQTFESLTFMCNGRAILPSHTCHSEGLKNNDVISAVLTPTSANAEQPLSIRMKSQDGHEVYFIVKPSTQFKKVFDAYLQRIGKARSSGFKFLFDGHRISDLDTPSAIGLENDDFIDVFNDPVGC